MEYPTEKYRFVINGNTVIAISSYAGKTVKGKAICASDDAFDLEKGKELAAARCAAKIANKRVNRARDKCYESYQNLLEAQGRGLKMSKYLDDAIENKQIAENRVELLLGRM